MIYPLSLSLSLSALVSRPLMTMRDRSFFSRETNERIKWFCPSGSLSMVPLEATVQPSTVYSRLTMNEKKHRFFVHVKLAVVVVID